MHSMPQVRREPLADQAAELLLARIKAGEWTLGAKIPGETTLASQLGVGRSTVREAIRLLAGRGVLTSRHGAGVFVSALDVRDDWDTVLRRADISAVLEARIAIEVESAALAADRRSTSNLRALQQALDYRDTHRTVLEEHVDADHRFHRCIVASAQNAVLLELFDTFTPRNRLAMIDMLRLRGSYGNDADHAAHRDIYDAIKDRDADRAATLTRHHLVAMKAGLS